nr:glycosyltransferase family 2 protein [Halomonas cerina]
MIVPAYNVEDYINGCVESLVHQSHPDLEIIVVNDASTDKTSGAVLEGFTRDSRVRLIDLEHNVGVHAARARGIREARGRFIGFVDSDDKVAPHMVERLFEVAQAHHADIVVCGAEKVSESGESLGRKVRFTHSFARHHHLLEAFCSRQYGSGVLWNKLYKAELIKKHGTIPLDRKVDASEDYVVNVGCFSEATCVATVADTLYFYLIRADSASRNEDKARHFVRIMAAYASCLEIYADFSPQQKEEVTKLFASQLCFSDYQIHAVEQLYRHDENLRESLSSLSALYPAGVYTLIHAFHRPENASNHGFIKYAGQVHKAIRKWF